MCSPPEKSYHLMVLGRGIESHVQHQRWPCCHIADHPATGQNTAERVQSHTYEGMSLGLACRTRSGPVRSPMGRKRRECHTLCRSVLEARRVPRFQPTPRRSADRNRSRATNHPGAGIRSSGSPETSLAELLDKSYPYAGGATGALVRSPDCPRPARRSAKLAAAIPPGWPGRAPLISLYFVCAGWPCKRACGRDGHASRHRCPHDSGNGTVVGWIASDGDGALCPAPWATPPGGCGGDGDAPGIAARMAAAAARGRRSVRRQDDPAQARCSARFPATGTPLVRAPARGARRDRHRPGTAGVRAHGHAPGSRTQRPFPRLPRPRRYDRSARQVDASETAVRSTASGRGVEKRDTGCYLDGATSEHEQRGTARGRLPVWDSARHAVCLLCVDRTQSHRR